MRQSILKKAFEGKLLNDSELDETRKDPEWEPADKLLERIKKENQSIKKKTRSLKL
jgi:type I restriction enzyme S subunit